MRRSLFSIVTASALLAGVQVASAQTTTTTTTWSNDQGTVIREYSTHEKFDSVNDPSFRPSVGVEVPGTVVLHPLPETMKIQDPERYSYTIINDRPVVVERTTRKVVHSWE
jgi:Protein of unknown function (DUF1236)